MTALLGFFAIVWGGLNRWRGHASDYKKYFPRPFNQALLALPLALIAAGAVAGYVAGWPLWAYGLVVFAAFIAVLVATTVAIVTGHGQYFLDLARKYIKPERFDFVVAIFFGRDPRSYSVSPYLHPDSHIAEYDYKIRSYGERLLYWRCVLGMAVTGVIVTIPAGLAAQNPALALAGAVKAPAYMAGFAFFDLCLNLGLTERRAVYIPRDESDDDPRQHESYLAIKFLPRHFDEAGALSELFHGIFLYITVALASCR